MVSLALGAVSALAALPLAACNFTPPTPIAYVSRGPAHGQPMNPIAALPVMCSAAKWNCPSEAEELIAKAARLAVSLSAPQYWLQKPSDSGGVDPDSVEGRLMTCGVETLSCQPGYQEMVANATRMAFELGGGNLVDSELINAELRLRTTRTQSVVGQGTLGETELGRAPSASYTNESNSSTSELTGRTWSDLPGQAQRELLAAMGIRGTLRTVITLGVQRGMSGQRTVTVYLGLVRLADESLAWESECGVETGDFHSEPQAIELATRCALESATLW